jgi:hypothetical protein
MQYMWDHSASAHLKPGVLWQRLFGAVAGLALLLQVVLAAPAALRMADAMQQYSLATGVICALSAPHRRDDPRLARGNPADHRQLHCRFCSLSTPPLAAAVNPELPATNAAAWQAVRSAPYDPPVQGPRFSPYTSRAPPGLA